MLGMLATIGRALARHWPALVALYLGGTLARYVIIEIAGFIGAYTSVGGLLILPLATLARLAAFVGMFLVLRSSLRELSAIAPPPETPELRRKAFIASLLGGVLPFFAVYAATGNIREDISAYSARALEVLTGEIAEAGFNGAPEIDTSGTVTDVLLGWPALVAIAIALAGRWAWGRWEERLPRWVALPAVYLEGVWVFLAAVLIDDSLGSFTAWIDSRQALAWVADVRDWLAEFVAPVAWVWDGFDWLIATIGGAIGQPLAWLTIAGVMYGQAISAEAPRLAQRLRGTRLSAMVDEVEEAKTRFGALPEWLRTRLQGAWDSVVARLVPIWRALVLMVRGGPVLFGTAVLLYALVVWLEGGLSWLLTRLIGPQGFHEFWAVWDVLLLLPVAIIIEALRVTTMAGAYDSMIGKLRAQEAASAGEPAATTDTDAETRAAISGADPLSGPGSVLAGD